MTRHQPHSRKTSLSSQKVCLAALLLLVCALLQGCPIFPSYGHPDAGPPHLEQTDECPDTFQMFVPRIFRKQEDWVKAVRVTDWKEAYKGNILVCWEIRAKEPVSMHGFQVEVGRVPEAFEQIAPDGEVKFTPEPGKLYYIAVSLQIYPRREWIQSGFEAGVLEERNIEVLKARLRNMTRDEKQ